MTFYTKRIAEQVADICFLLQITFFLNLFGDSGGRTGIKRGLLEIKL